MIRVFRGISEYQKAVLSGEVSKAPAAVTLGKFDGIHRGHQKLLSVIREKAREGMQGIMFCINVRSRSLLSEEEKSSFAEQFGIGTLIECPFSKSLMETSPGDFISGILKDTLGAEFVAVGTDYRFGFRRAGNAETLLRLQDRYGYQAEVVDKECYLGEEISSTRVRKAVEEGNMELAEALLGRPYPVWGRVVHGRQLGRTIGFPTANVIPDVDKILPPDGVYASVTTLEDGTRLAGVTNIGKNPTIADDNIRSAETYLTDFSGDLYGQQVRTGLVHYSRGEVHFASVKELGQQLARDAENGRKLIRERGLL